MEKTTLVAPDISCEHCQHAIEGALGELAGVNTVKVDIPTKTPTSCTNSPWSHQYWIYQLPDQAQWRFVLHPIGDARPVDFCHVGVRVTPRAEWAFVLHVAEVLLIDILGDRAVPRHAERSHAQPEYHAAARAHRLIEALNRHAHRRRRNRYQRDRIVVKGFYLAQCCPDHE